MQLAPSIAVTTVEDAVLAAQSIKYPVMIRSAFALGGLGSGICYDEAHLRDMASRAFSLTNQVRGAAGGATLAALRSAGLCRTESWRSECLYPPPLPPLAGSRRALPAGLEGGGV